MRKAVQEKQKIKLKKVKRIQGVKTRKFSLAKADYIFLGILLIIVIAVILHNNYANLGLVLNKNITSEDTVSIDLKSSSSQIIPFKNQVLVYNSGNIICYSNHGSKNWEIKLEDVVNSDINANGDYIIITNKDKNIVHLYKNKYEKAIIKLEGEIYSSYVTNKGTTIVEYNSNGGKTTLAIYNNLGELKYNVRLNSKRIGKYVLSDNEKYLAYIDLNVDGISATTKICMIDLEASQENTQNLEVYTMIGELIYDVEFDGNDLLARTEDSVILYNVKNKVIKEDTLENVSLTYLKNDKHKVAYVSLDNLGNYELNIRDLFEENARNIKLDESPKYFEYTNGIVYIGSQTKINVYNSLGMNIKNYESDVVLTKPVVFNDGKSVAMLFASKLVMFNI